MSAIRHENVNVFVGVCITAPNVSILMQSASKGCLRNVLQNEKIKLNVDFLHSFVSDIAAVSHCLLTYWLSVCLLCPVSQYRP